VSKTPNSRPYAEIAGEVAGAVAAMDWLVDYGCSCDAEALAWATMADAYRDPNFDIVRLRELRDPKNLGRALREHPARFSMLTPNSHLKAWLSFADDKSLREQALAGARIWPMVQIRHRAIEQEAAQRARWEADFSKLAVDSPLWSGRLSSRRAMRLDGIPYSSAFAISTGANATPKSCRPRPFSQRAVGSRSKEPR
jgi:hypothetical protein